jgi:hypothetical protein
MRFLFVLSLALLTPPTSAQTSAASADPCPSGQNVRAEKGRLLKLLGEKGVDALVDDIMCPQNELWKRLKAALLRPNGWSYFSEGVLGAALPEMNGTFISQSGLEIVLGVSDPVVPDVMLSLDSPLERVLQPGTRVLFRGVATAFHSRPFLFVLKVKNSDISLLPARVSQ